MKEDIQQTQMCSVWLKFYKLDFRALLKNKQTSLSLIDRCEPFSSVEIGHAGKVRSNIYVNWFRSVTTFSIVE